MEKSLLSVLLVLLTGSTAVAQDINQFKVLSDSAYQTNTQYKSCNRYQKDAILFMDLVADTHPYYVRPELREEWYAKKETLLEKCKSIETDEALADALNETLGKQKDKHTCVTTAKQVKEVTLTERKKLTEAGAVEEVLEGGYVVGDPVFYDKEVGLITDNHWLEESLIV